MLCLEVRSRLYSASQVARQFSAQISGAVWSLLPLPHICPVQLASVSRSLATRQAQLLPIAEGGVGQCTPYRNDSIPLRPETIRDPVSTIGGACPHDAPLTCGSSLGLSIRMSPSSRPRSWTSPSRYLACTAPSDTDSVDAPGSHRNISQPVRNHVDDAPAR